MYADPSILRSQLHSGQPSVVRPAPRALLHGLLAALMVLIAGSSSAAAESSSIAAETLEPVPTVQARNDPAFGAWTRDQGEFIRETSGMENPHAVKASDTLAHIPVVVARNDPADGAWSRSQGEFLLAMSSERGLAERDTPEPEPVAVFLPWDVSRGFGGNDDRDPAASGSPELSMTSLGAAQRTQSTVSSSFSGDDDYDPAAGGNPEAQLSRVGAGASAQISCGLSEDEIASWNEFSTTGGYSGDDDYDPAAGGMPEMSLAAFGVDAGLRSACLSAAGN